MAWNYRVKKHKVNLIVGEMFFKSLLHKVYEQEKCPGEEGDRYFFVSFQGEPVKKSH